MPGEVRHLRCKLCGIAGMGVETQAFSYNLEDGEAVLYGRAEDTERNTTIFRPRELVLGPRNCLYCPETDNPEHQCRFRETTLG